MNITTKNDGKEKQQSWTAKTEHDDSAFNWNYQFSAEAYGANEDAAKDNLRLALLSLVSELQPA